MTSLDSLKEQVNEFARERDWDQFHSPKNLAIALSVECSELLEHFQWLETEASEVENLSEATKREIQFEMADVLLYLLRLAERLDVDLLEVCEQKLKINAEKYPVSLAKGNAVKYSRRKTDGSDD